MQWKHPRSTSNSECLHAILAQLPSKWLKWNKNIRPMRSNKRRKKKSNNNNNNHHHTIIESAVGFTLEYGFSDIVDSSSAHILRSDMTACDVMLWIYCNWVNRRYEYTEKGTGKSGKLAASVIHFSWIVHRDVFSRLNTVAANGSYYSIEQIGPRYVKITYYLMELTNSGAQD